MVMIVMAGGSLPVIINESLTKGTHIISVEEIICKALRQFNLGVETQLLNNEIDVFGKQKVRMQNVWETVPPPSSSFFFF